MKCPLALLAALAIAISGTAQSPAVVSAAQSAVEGGVLSDAIRARGVDHWGPNDLLMLPTRPPFLPVHTIAEWEKVNTVMLALDSDFIKSLALNRKARTVDRARDVFNRDKEIREVLNELACKPTDEGADANTAKEDSEDEAAEGERDADKDACVGGELADVVAEGMFDRLALAHDLIATLSELTKYVDVLVFVEDRDPSGLVAGGPSDLGVQGVIDELAHFPGAKSFLHSPHLLFAPATFDTKWLRDYGPVFVRSSAGVVISVDTRYEAESTSQEERLTALTGLLKGASGEGHDSNRAAELQEQVERATRVHDDQFPTVAGGRFRQMDGSMLRRAPVSVVRPPILLAGGDFLSDGATVGFTSTRTLRDNGGNTELLDATFKEYFGVDNLVYLHPLPGETVKHIDMFLQVVSPSILLLGKFDGRSADATEQRLQSAAAAALEEDLQIISDYYKSAGKRVKVIDSDTVEIDPKSVNIVRVPMPIVQRPYARVMEDALKGFTESYRDYEDHGTLLNILSRFKSQQQSLSEGLGLLKNLFASASTEPLEDHDLELIGDIREVQRELVSNLTRYAGLSGRYHDVLSQFQQKSDGAGADLDRLERSARSAVHENKQVPEGDVEAAVSSLNRLLEAASGVLSIAQTLEENEDLERASLLKAKKALQEMDRIQKTYEYGTDLYRTYLNLLQIHTGNSVVLAVPTYRDAAIAGVESSAIKRIVTSFKAAYGEVSLVPVPSDAFIKEMGSIHCLTKVLPQDVTFVKSDRNRAPGGEQP